MLYCIKNERIYQSMLKKIMLGAAITLSGVSLLSGCSAASTSSPTSTEQKKADKKTEAVKAVKASIEGIFKGNQTLYEEYYGEGSYDKMIDQVISDSQFSGGLSRPSTPEEKVKFYKLFQGVLNKSNIEYEAKSETEVTAHIQQVQFDTEAMKKWSEDTIASGKFTQDELSDSDKMTELMFQEIINGNISVKKLQVIDLVIQVEEIDGKFEVVQDDREKIGDAILKS